jgi:hypothetical protein
MADFKGTKGKWKVVKYEKTDFSLCRNEIHFSDDEECVAEFVHNDYDALLISKAPEMLEILKKCERTLRLVYECDTKEIEQLIKEATEI